MIHGGKSCSKLPQTQAPWLGEGEESRDYTALGDGTFLSIARSLSFLILWGQFLVWVPNRTHKNIDSSVEVSSLKLQVTVC